MNAICIKCWNPDALVKLHMDGTGYFECAECEETFHCEEVETTLEAMKNQWESLLTWVKAYPGGVKPM